MKYYIFLLGYLYFLYSDIRHKKIDLIAIVIYACAALIYVSLNKDNITMYKFIDILFSISFGIIIYLLSYFSGEGIGIADGMYFVINGFLLTLRENLILFLTGILVAFVIGIFIFIFSKKKNKRDIKIPFMLCFLPTIVGYILCIH